MDPEREWFLISIRASASYSHGPVSVMLSAEVDTRSAVNMIRTSDHRLVVRAAYALADVRLTHHQGEDTVTDGDCWTDGTMETTLTSRRPCNYLVQQLRVV